MLEPLGEEERRVLRSHLSGLHSDLKASLAAGEQASKPVDLDEPIGRLSRMDAMQQQHMAAANRRACELRLAQVDAALRRLDAGRYGTCLTCEEEIGFARLQVRPEAALCIDCQSERDER